MVALSYRLQADLDRDGFFNAGVEPSDALNLIPAPVRWTDLTYQGYPAATIAARDEETAYGLKVLRVTNTSATTDSLEFGISGGTVDQLPVAASTQYTVVVWVKGISAYSGVGVKLIVSNQAYTLLGVASAVTLTADWQRLTLTVSTGVGDTHVYIRIEKDSSAALAVYDVAGFMLVAGASGPTVFNAGAASNAYDELTGYVKALTARYGMDDGFREIAPPAELMALLQNGDGAFLPEKSDAAYYGLLRPGLLLRLQAALNGVTTTLWLGRLKALDVAPGGYTATRDVTLTATDMLLDLQAGDYKPALQQGVTADAALTDLFETDAPWARWPYEDNPAAAASYTDFEVGKTVQAWIGDNSENVEQRGVMPRQHIEDVVTPEGGGRFFWHAAAGKWTFHNREHDILAAEVATFTGDEFIAELSQYVYGDRIINKVSYDFVPRRLGGAGDVVYEYPSLPYAIGKRNQTTEFDARYTSPTEPNARVGVIDGIAPVAGVDYSATDELTGNVDRTDRLTVTVTFYAEKAKVRIVSSENSTIYLQDFKLRGTPLITYDRMTVSEQNDDSIDVYGIHEQPSTLLLSIDTETFARALAQWTIARYGVPFGRFASVTLQAYESDTLAGHALNRTVGDKIRITNTRLGHDRAYVIAGIETSVDADQKGSHLCKWVLTPLSLNTYARTDVHDTDSGARIAL